MRVHDASLSIAPSRSAFHILYRILFNSTDMQALGDDRIRYFDST